MRKVYSSFLILFAFLFPITAAGNEVELFIHVHNQRIYFPGDSVFIRMTIQNNSPDVYRFNVSDERLFNIDFDVRNMNNLEAKPAAGLIMTESNARRIFYRGLEILPGEEFSFIEDIAAYRALEEGLYIIHARFYPELRGIEGQNVLVSNSLTVSVREGFRRAEAAVITAEERVSDEMRRADLPPDEVVSYTLEARMHSRAEQFLQYLDTARLYTARQQRREQFLRLSAFRQQEVLRDYEQNLLNNETDEGISLVPNEYRILQTTYGQSIGAVIVEQRYDEGSYVEVKRFTYDLERRDGIWYIVRYQVVNRGTE